MKNLVLILVICSVLSCTTKSENQSITQTDTLTNEIKVVQTDAKTIDTVLYKSAIVHNFSSPVDKDTFKIILTGQSIKNGQFRFQIIKKDGQVILDESYETTMLLGYGPTSNPTDKEKEEYIMIRIDKFFNEVNFHQPAISKKDTFDEDYGEKEIWDDIINDQTAIGFYYMLGEEDGRQIAFSKKLGKVVLYFNCC